MIMTCPLPEITGADEVNNERGCQRRRGGRPTLAAGLQVISFTVLSDATENRGIASTVRVSASWLEGGVQYRTAAQFPGIQTPAEFSATCVRYVPIEEEPARSVVY